MAGPVKAASNEFILYLRPGSYNSNKVHIALLEKQLEFTLQPIYLDKMEHLQPWYIKANPAALVPMLQHGDTFIPDSMAIVKYLDDTFDKPRLQPNPESDIGKQNAELVEKIASINVTLVTFGCAKYPQLTADSKFSEELKTYFATYDEKTLLELEKMAQQHPDIKQLYGCKVPILEARIKLLQNPDNVQKEIDHIGDILVEVENVLAQTEQGFPGKETWLLGETFYVVDIMLGLLLHRLRDAGFSKQLFEGKLPHIENYFTRIQERDSFKKGCRSP